MIPSLPPLPTLAVLPTLAALLPLAAQAPRPPSQDPNTPPAPDRPEGERRALGVEDGDRWRSIRGARLSERGAWILYQLQPANGDDGELVLVASAGDARHQVPRGRDGRFDFDERHAVCLVSPEREAVKAYRKAQKEKGPKGKGEGEGKGDAPSGEPVDGLAILDLANGARVDVPRVKSFRTPDEAGGWIAYLLMEPEKKGKGEEDEGEAQEAEPEKPEKKVRVVIVTKRAPGAETPGEARKKGKKKKKEKKPGTDLVLRELASGTQRTFPHVLSYAFSKDGATLAFTTSSEDGKGDGVYALTLPDGEPRALLEGEGEYESLVFDEASAQLAFLTNRDDYGAEEPAWSLYHARTGDAEARLLASAGTPGVQLGWGVSPHRAPRFSESGRRLLFGTAPLPEPEPEIDEEERVVLDVWSWTDDRIQPQQLHEREAELQRSYLALVPLHPGAGRVVQLGTTEIPDVTLGDEGDAQYALGRSDLRWRHMRQWDPAVFRDAFRIDAGTGSASLVAERLRARYQLSPGGRYVYWWDGQQRHWFALDLEQTEPEPRCLTAGIPHPLWNELHDTPTLPRAYGTGGWLEGDAGLIVYDRHDLWLVDPAGTAAPQCVTEGVGRREDLRFRRVDLDLEEAAVPPMQELLLSAFHLERKRAGFWRDRLVGGGDPVPLLMDDKRFGTPVKARSGDVLRLTREDFVEYPDLWLADLGLGSLRRVCEANPQQSEYLWGTAELVSWSSADGVHLQGILYRPEGFDPDVRHPLVVYFYERMSDGLHRHNDPVPSRSSIRFSYYTSNGYCVFVPDIPYRIGYPGESCASAVLPGILALVDAGIVDPERIGVQGHSWGGYQIAYLVTRTNLFAGAVAGAPVSNMTSAYGGIRYGSGMSRQFQYEKTQSRLGGSLWEVPDRYHDNSPLFFADKVETPLLMLHNDQDGAVPWTQGIEYFVALKRLGKPVWLLNYNGEAHGIGKYANKRDYAARMSQFFDHHLRGAPPPVWMVEGVPAVKKGRTLGLDLIRPEGS